MATTTKFSGHSVSLFLGLLLCSFILLVVSINTRYFAVVESAIRWISQPVAFVANLPVTLTDSTRVYITSRQQLQSENEALKLELAKTQVSNAELEDVKTRLNQLLEREGDRREGPITQLIVDIKAVNTDRDRQEFTIDHGQQQGVTLDSTVLDGNGVRGRVIDVFTNSARVLQINDKRSGVPVLHSRTGQYFIATGNGLYSPLTLDNVNINANIEVGDELVTSGLGEAYPRGFLVGAVSEILKEENQTEKYVAVQPSAALGRKTYLRVIIKEETE